MKFNKGDIVRNSNTKSECLDKIILEIIKGRYKFIYISDYNNRKDIFNIDKICFEPTHITDEFNYKIGIHKDFAKNSIKRL